MLSRRGRSDAGAAPASADAGDGDATPDGAGGVDAGVERGREPSAEIVPLRADEREVGEGLGDLTLHKIVIRKRDDVSPGDRFVLGARMFRIGASPTARRTGATWRASAKRRGAP